MKILIASTPATGHLNPLLSIGRILLAAGHHVAVLTADVLRDRVEDIGATFYSLPPGANIDLRNIEKIIPDIASFSPGPERRLVVIERFFIDVVPAQSDGLDQVFSAYQPDLILADNTFFGVFPMLLGHRSARPPIVICGTMFLHAPRDDGAPAFQGLPPARTVEDRRLYASLAAEQDRLVNNSALEKLNFLLSMKGSRPLPMNFHEAAVNLPELFLQMTVPGFEFPRLSLPKPVEYVGILPIVPSQAPMPDWAGDLDGTRKVVLVTQGTLSNVDFRQLVIPTLNALADEAEIMVVVTTGGRTIDALPFPLPENARVASFLPFEWLLPMVDVFVTNGGYGSVNQALSYGIPIVGAGMTEDKGDVNARVAWSGVGINLATSEPSEQMLADAIRTVLADDVYRDRAKAISKEFAAIDTQSLILERLEALVNTAPARAAEERR